MKTPESNVNALVDNLFRHEYGRIVSSLSRVFGATQLEMVEDVVQESLVEAMRTWPYQGIPGNPAGWLYLVARRKALNLVKREALHTRLQNEQASLLLAESEPSFAEDRSDFQIQDDQLRMLFVCCDPSLTRDSQVALALKVLCGFSIDEIVRAFLSKYDTINRRLVRARKLLGQSDPSFDLPRNVELDDRLRAVLETVYFLFNGGYQASSGVDVIRYDLCLEAIRLAGLIADHPDISDKSGVHALLALMYLNVSRFQARVDAAGTAVELADQDRGLWDASLMARGFDHMNKASQGDRLTKYHVLAAISACHCAAGSFEETDWERILTLYDHLLTFDDSPMVLLNRAVALRYTTGPEEALRSLDELELDSSLANHHLLLATKASFLEALGQWDEAAQALRKAISNCPSSHELVALEQKLERLPSTR